MLVILLNKLSFTYALFGTIAFLFFLWGLLQCALACGVKCAAPRRARTGYT